MKIIKFLVQWVWDMLATASLFMILYYLYKVWYKHEVIMLFIQS